MEKCIVFKLFESIDGDYPKMGELTMHVTLDSGSGSISINNSSQFSARVKGSGLIGLASDDITHTSLANIASGNRQLYFSSGEYDIIISDKYTLLQTGGLNTTSSPSELIGRIRAEEVEYCTAMNKVVLWGDAKYLRNLSALQDIYMDGEQCYGDLCLNNNAPLKSVYIQNSTIKATMSLFASCPWSDNATLDVYNNPNVSGSLDVLAAALASSKSNGVTLRIHGNGIVTYKSNGDGTGSDIVIPSNGYRTVTFDGQGGYAITTG